MVLHGTKENSDTDHVSENASLPHRKRDGCPGHRGSGEYVLFTFVKEIKMASNQKSSGSGSKQGSNQGSSKQSGNAGSSSGGRSGGTQGGTHEQHVEAGRQSHKNDGNKSGGRK
jgi:hypothetical protein